MNFTTHLHLKRWTQGFRYKDQSIMGSASVGGYAKDRPVSLAFHWSVPSQDRNAAWIGEDVQAAVRKTQGDFPGYEESAPAVNLGGSHSLILHDGAPAAEVFLEANPREEEEGALFLRVSADFAGDLAELCGYAVLRRLRVMEM